MTIGLHGECRTSGHLGELVQGRLGPAGPVALITLPCAGLWVDARVAPGAFALFPGSAPVIREDRLAKLFAALGRAPLGRWTFTTNMPVAAGAGSSSAALLSALKILAPDLGRQRMEEICLTIEKASDPLLSLHPERELWAPRRGITLSHLPPLPKMRVVGGFFSGTRPTDAADERFPDITTLIDGWANACQNPEAIGQLVTQSALWTARLRGEVDAAMLERLSERYGAYGVSIAHTGKACALLLPASRDPKPIVQDLSGLGLSRIQTFYLGGAL